MPILKPHAEAVKRHGEISWPGVICPTPGNQCWPEGVPIIFGNLGMQMLQQAHPITILHSNGRDVRHVLLNENHSMVDRYGTPHTQRCMSWSTSPKQRKSAQKREPIHLAMETEGACTPVGADGIGVSCRPARLPI